MQGADDVKYEALELQAKARFHQLSRNENEENDESDDAIYANSG